jgi:hypothetical protein
VPRIPTYTSEANPNGYIRSGGSLPVVDASGVAQGLGQLANNVERQRRIAEHETKLQEHQREVADKSAAQEQYLSMRDLLADSYEEHANGIADGSVDKTSAKTKWSERTKALIDLGIEKVPPSQRGAIQSRLNQDASRFDLLVGRVVRKRDQSDTLSAVDSSLEFAARMAEKDPGAARALALQTLQDYGPAAGLNAAQIQAKAGKWKEEAAYTIGLGLITRGKADNAALLEADKAINGLTDLDPRRKVELLDRSANYRAANDQRKEIDANRRERAAERMLRVAEHEFNAFQGLAEKGGQIDPSYVDRVVKATAGTPYQAAVRGIADSVRSIGGFASRPITEQNATIAYLDEQMAKNGRTPELQDRREKLSRVRDQAVSDAQKDPLQAYAERGGGVAPPVDSMSLDSLLQTLPARAEHATIVAKWAGRHVSPLSPQEADKLSDQLDALPVAQRAQRVADLSSALTPQQAQALAKQMEPKNRALALEFAAGASKTDFGRYTSQLIAMGRQAIKDKAIKEDSAAMTGLRAAVAREIGDALAGQAREDVIDTARFISLGKEAAGERINAADAVRLAIGGPLVEHNGKRVPVVQGVDLPERLRTYPFQAVNAQAPDGVVYLPGGRPMGVPEFMAALPDAQLEPAGLGRYFVRAGGSIAYNQDRKPIVIEVR